MPRVFYWNKSNIGMKVFFQFPKSVGASSGKWEYKQVDLGGLKAQSNLGSERLFLCFFLNGLHLLFH